MRKLQIQSETEAANLNGYGIIRDMEQGAAQDYPQKERTARGKAAIVSSLLEPSSHTFHCYSIR